MSTAVVMLGGESGLEGSVASCFCDNVKVAAHIEGFQPE